jgi:hypothetical protein
MPSLTYAELAEALRITPASANKLARRRRWPRIPGNDGKARVSVPEDALVPRDVPTDSPPPSPLDVPPVGPPDNQVHELQALVARLERELAGVHGELSGVREALDEARARAGAAEARSSELSADLAAARTATTKAIAAYAALAEPLEALAAERSRSLWDRLTRLLGRERAA